MKNKSGAILIQRQYTNKKNIFNYEINIFLSLFIGTLRLDNYEND